MVTTSYAEINNKTLAVLVNLNDPESIAIANYYKQNRGISTENVIYLKFTSGVNTLSESEFLDVQAQLDKKVPEHIQAYALAWRKPWRVECMSITSAFAFGFDRQNCAKGCRPTKLSKYYNSNSKSPFTDYKIRPAMLLSGYSVETVKRLIDKGVASDYARPYASAYLLDTSDKLRNVRAYTYRSTVKMFDRILKIEQIKADAIRHKENVMFYFTGRSHIRFVDQNEYLPGAIADHLTSAGGNLFSSYQMSVLEWIEAGITGTYGAVVEPCNFVQKFPQPAIVMDKYLSGESLIEAYWKSVAMPGQGVFVGEPLAAPYKGCQLTFNNEHFEFSNQIQNDYVHRRSKNCH